MGRVGGSIEVLSSLVKRFDLNMTCPPDYSSPMVSWFHHQVFSPNNIYPCYIANAICLSVCEWTLQRGGSNIRSMDRGVKRQLVRSPDQLCQYVGSSVTRYPNG